MRTLFAAAALAALFAGAASAEPVKLDEAALGEVAGGVSLGFGSIDIGVANIINTPVVIDNNFDFDTQIGAALAVNTNAVIAAFSENIAGFGNSVANLDFATGAAVFAP
jgi:hypothetical protein